MKANLLKRLRNQARNHYRIVPTWDGKWVIEHAVIQGDKFLYWQRTNECFADLSKAIECLEEKREFAFRCLANNLIQDRIYQRRFEQVKDL